MGETTARAELIGMLRRERGLDVAAIAALCSGERYAPAPLTAAESAALNADAIANAPLYVQGEYPEWLDAHLARMFGDERGRGGRGARQSRAARHARQHAQG